MVTQKSKQKRKLYMAYGSNMNIEQMSKRCPDAKVVGSSYLLDWRLTMPFYANIEKEKGSKVPVLIWEISEKDEHELDIYEGYPTEYGKQNLTAEVNGQEVEVMVYIMTEEYKVKNVKPRDGYEDTIRQGYKDAGFDLEEFQPVRHT